MTELKDVLRDAVLTIQLAAAAVGATLYVASFFGYEYENGAFLISSAFVILALTSILTALRDRRFFLKNWGFGLMGIRKHFPFQMFPARRIEWLNPISWALMAVLLLHFIWLVMSAPGPGMPETGSVMALRYVSLMITFGGILSALMWRYPPTELPLQAE